LLSTAESVGDAGAHNDQTQYKAFGGGDRKKGAPPLRILGSS